MVNNYIAIKIICSKLAGKTDPQQQDWKRGKTSHTCIMSSSSPIIIISSSSCRSSREVSGSDLEQCESKHEKEGDPPLRSLEKKYSIELE